MFDGIFICADCGFVGKGTDAVLVSPEDGGFVGENEAVKPLLLKNKMGYAGCPECSSPNVYFSRPKMSGVNIPAHTIPQPVAPARKITERVVSSKPALAGGKNVTSVIESEPEVIDEEQDIFGDLEEDALIVEDDFVEEQPEQPAPKRKAGGTKTVIKLRGGETKEIDTSQTGVGKIREYVKRGAFKRQCRSCGREFETKHPDMLVCRPCTEGFTK